MASNFCFYGGVYFNTKLAVSLDTLSIKDLMMQFEPPTSLLLGGLL